MDKVLFVQNVKFYCERRGIKPTVACRDSGAGKDFLNQISTRGQTPSVEKVEQLAHYLGVTVSTLLGESAPIDQTMTLHDSAAVIRPDDFRRLSWDEVDMVLAYRRATPKERGLIDGILQEYKKGTTAETG